MRSKKLQTKELPEFNRAPLTKDSILFIFQLRDYYQYKGTKYMWNISKILYILRITQDQNGSINKIALTHVSVNEQVNYCTEEKIFNNWITFANEPYTLLLGMYEWNSLSNFSNEWQYLKEYLMHASVFYSLDMRFLARFTSV